MIEFKDIRIEDKERYEAALSKSGKRGCETSFANLFLWGKQEIAFVGDIAVLRGTFSSTIYPFPIGEGDKKEVLDEILQDAKEKNIPLKITSIYGEEKGILEKLYPNAFEFNSNRDSFDYVYDINDLADLLGKKYHKKRTHLNRFKSEHPNFKVEPFSEENIEGIKELVYGWYKKKENGENTGDYDYEKVVFEKALNNFRGLCLEGLALVDNGEVLAVTFGSKMNEDTFDVHFEKARADVDGAYTAINCEFANYIRKKYPEIRYLDREEDMGLEGLRKAKMSYYPHHLVEKYTAKLIN